MKKDNVLFIPMSRHKPMRKDKFPMTRSALSKNSKTPSVKRRRLTVRKPIPIPVFLIFQIHSILLESSKKYIILNKLLYSNTSI